MNINKYVDDNIHVHLKDGMGVDICMKFILAYAYADLYVHM